MMISPKKKDDLVLRRRPSHDQDMDLVTGNMNNNNNNNNNNNSYSHNYIFHQQQQEQHQQQQQQQQHHLLAHNTLISSPLSGGGGGTINSVDRRFVARHRRRQPRGKLRGTKVVQQAFSVGCRVVFILIVALVLFYYLLDRHLQYSLIHSWRQSAGRKFATPIQMEKTTSLLSSSSQTNDKLVILEDRLRGALWSFFSGDALAAPTHWYYGGQTQIQNDYGPNGITDYTKPKYELSGSILNKSNLNGGGRQSKASQLIRPVIIGEVINHGKQDLWDSEKSIHYHATLQAGENTLEVSLARVVMKSIVATKGRFDASHFRNLYMQFMQTPKSHNDTYASTCHRMFFANLIHHQMDPVDCPDDDLHNVNTMDGLVLPTIVALATAAKSAIDQDEEGSIQEYDMVAQQEPVYVVDEVGGGEYDDGEGPTEANDAFLNNVMDAAASCASVTRGSKALKSASSQWAWFVATALLESDELSVWDVMTQVSQTVAEHEPDPQPTKSLMSACYLPESFPTLIDILAKYLPTFSGNDDGNAKRQQQVAAKSVAVWEALLDNANIGGENVHRGSVMGAILGARAGYKNLPNHLKQGLYHYQQISKEIDNFVTAVLYDTDEDVVITGSEQKIMMKRSR